MGTALLGVAQMFLAAIMNGIASFIEGMKDKLGAAGEKIFGDADESLRDKADGLSADSKKNMKEGGSGLMPYVAEMAGRFGETAKAVGQSYMDTFKGTEGVMEQDPEAMSKLNGFADKMRAAMDKAKQKPEGGTPGAGGNEAEQAKAAAALPATAGRLAGAISTLTGGSNGQVLQQEANALLKTIADNTAPNKQKPAPRRGRAARAVGTFT